MSWLEQLPAESTAWAALHEHTLLIKAVSKAEDDVTEGRVKDLATVTRYFEDKWQRRVGQSK